MGDGRVAASGALMLSSAFEYRGLTDRKPILERFLGQVSGLSCAVERHSQDGIGSGKDERLGYGMRDVMREEDFQTELVGVQQRFKLRLEAYLEELRLLHGSLGTSDKDRALCAEIHVIAHRLHGTAKMVGFDKTGTLSADLELSITQALAASGPLDLGQVTGRLKDLLAEIECVLRQ
jgi:HPt (histidine-containing phosphotransfer) domain-containing protein